MSCEQSYFSPEEMDAFMAKRRRAAEDARADLARRGHPNVMPHAGVGQTDASDGVPDLTAAAAEPTRAAGDAA